MRASGRIWCFTLVILFAGGPVRQINGDLSSLLLSKAPESVKNFRIIWREPSIDPSQFDRINNHLNYPDWKPPPPPPPPPRRVPSSVPSEPGQEQDLGEQAVYEDALSDEVDQFHDASDTQLTDVDSSSSPNKDGGKRRPKSPSWTVLGLMSKFALKAIEPTSQYIKLVRRYQKWFQDFNQLKSELVSDDHKPLIKVSALDVLRLEYAKVDEHLYREACEDLLDDLESSGKLPALSKAQQNKVENVDFVLKVLRLLIRPLETRLEALKARSSTGELAASSQADEEALRRLNEAAEEQQNQSVQVAIERAKRIGVKSAKHFALVEMRNLIKFVALNALATRIKNRDSSTLVAGYDPLAYLEPIIMLMGEADTSFLVTHLRDMKFRAALGLVSQLNPLQISCKKQRTPQPAAAAAPISAPPTPVD